ncbi:MAG TPA: hypothetical protein VFG73_07080 [Rhodanobacteraceae bacterium]|nr:hypothetical protein [Rhodanobacteraceae bacterium]
MDAGPLRFAELHDSTPAAPLFRRKFGHPPPDYPHHIACLMRCPDGDERVACYVHFLPHGELLLGGGACVDNRLLRMLDAVQRRRLREGGGLYRLTLEFALRHFAGRYDAIFGYCGDRTAEAADRAVGFVSTPHENLLVYWTRQDVGEARRAALIARAHAAGAF